MATEMSTTDQAAYDALMIALGDGTYNGRPIANVATQRYADHVSVLLTYADDESPPADLYHFDYGINVGPK